jgi:hypothetical protein
VWVYLRPCLDPESAKLIWICAKYNKTVQLVFDFIYIYYSMHLPIF